MSHIITNDEYYKNISNILRERLGTDYHYYPAEMPDAIRRIPQSIAGVDDVITGIYLYDHDEEGYPTKLKVVGWSLNNKETKFPLSFKDDKFYSHLKEIEFLNCDFKYFSSSFQYMSKLERVILPEGMPYIQGFYPYGLFQFCESLTYVKFPNTITYIDKLAFDHCIRFSDIAIPDSVRAIYDNAFSNCTSLTTINLPSNLTSIGQSVFSNCTSLTTINLPSNLTSIGQSAFLNCTSLTTINLPSTLTYIGGATFINCPNLKIVELGQGFNANNLNLSYSTKYSRETIVSWLNALADRTGQTAYKLIIGPANLKKLTEEDIAIATAKNWTIA